MPSWYVTKDVRPTIPSNQSILQTIPFPYLKITPEEKYLSPKNNPPNVSITFFENGINLKNITCYSNEENKWRTNRAISSLPFVLLQTDL